MPYALILSKSPYGRTPYDRWLAGTGLRPIVLTGPEHAEAYSHLETYAFSDYDHNANVERKALSLAKQRDIELIIARAESDVLRAAHLRAALGIPGQHVASGRYFRDKGRMRRAAKRAGIKVPRFCLVDDVLRLTAFVDEVGFPIVVKPRGEGGSTGVVIIRTEPELESFLACVRLADMIAEEYVEGAMYHVDGLVVGGKVEFIHPFKYVNGCLAYRNDEFSGTYTLSEDNEHFETLVDCALRTLEALPTPSDTTFHCELWIDREGDAVLCEIASRTGGGMIVPTIEHSFGFNLDEQWVKAQAGLEVQTSSELGELAGGVVIPPGRGVLASAPASPPPPCVKRSVTTAEIGRTYDGGSKSGTFLFGYVVNGSDESAVEDNMRLAADWNRRNTRWEHRST